MVRSGSSTVRKVKKAILLWRRCVPGSLRSEVREMKIERWSANISEQQRLLARAPLSGTPELVERVEAVIAGVRTRGDEAVREFTLQFDGANISSFRVARSSIDNAFDALSPDLLRALRVAKANIEAFHKAQKPVDVVVETAPGITCELLWRPIPAVGLYAPGGTAPLFSSVLMLAIPAKLAGCERIVLSSPPNRDGNVNPSVLAAAALCGIDDVFAVGGAQAIAAMAFGTQQILKVDKIFGPGNAYVTMAKQLVSHDQHGAAFDMPAGPSEVMVLAGEGDRPDWVAADLLAQSEHDVLAQAILVTTSEAFAQTVIDEVEKQAVVLPRYEILRESLENARFLVVDDDVTALKVVNLYAPEHLIIHGDNARDKLAEIKSAGSVFLGSLTPETAGDYASGTNHVLPTYGASRAYGGLSLMSFYRNMTAQTVSEDGFNSLASTLVALAEAEGLEGHAAAVRRREDR